MVTTRTQASLQARRQITSDSKKQSRMAKKKVEKISEEQKKEKELDEEPEQEEEQEQDQDKEQDQEQEQEEQGQEELGQEEQGQEESINPGEELYCKQKQKSGVRDYLKGFAKRVIICSLLVMIGRSAWPKLQPYVWPEIPSKEGKLYVLTEKSFRGHVSRGDHFVMMYAPWCGHCQQLKPVWEQLAKSQVAGVKISKVDCTANQEICKSFLVHGYPTLLYFRNGENLGKYDGDKSLNGLKKHIKKMTKKSDGKKGKGAKSKPSSEL